MSAIQRVSTFELPDLVSTAIAGVTGLFGVETVAPWLSMTFQIAPDSWADLFVKAFVLAAFYWFGRVIAVALIGTG